MKSLRYLVCGAALLASVGASPASAVMWNPSGTNVAASQEGTGTLVTSSGGNVACTAGSTTLQAPMNGATAMPIAADPITFSGCTVQNSFTTHVTTFGTWHFTATSLTSVDITATPDATGKVATIVMTGLVCTITIDGPVRIPNNTWSNANHTLSINGTPTFPITTSSEACGTALGTTAHFQNTNFTAPTATIT